MAIPAPSALQAPAHLPGVAQLPSVAALRDPRALEPALGPVDEVTADPAQTDGSTAARHYRVRARLRTGETLALWLKHVRLADDWTARSSGDAVGREAALLAEPRLRCVWRSFAGIYRAFAFEDGGYALLMDDLGGRRLNDATAARTGRVLTEADEDAVLAAMAGLHARYWDAEVARLPWLQSVWHRLFLNGPRDVTRPSASFTAQRLRRWGLAVTRLPARVTELLLAPTEELVDRCAGLPQTVYHGDLKPGNLVLLPDGRVTAYDWGLVGGGPATFDLYWHLFVNWRGRTRRPDAVVARYRALLEVALGEPMPDPLWRRLVEAGLLCGAIMNTGGVIAGLEEGLPGAADEWDWRVQQLEQVI